MKIDNIKEHIKLLNGWETCAERMAKVCRKQCIDKSE